eukprot:m.240668 g.240668  ORF g.240668 m.240668 type:complete len:90 (-) comp26288_c0_seq4:3288-3557(-)
MGVVYEDEGEVESKPFAAGKGETGSLALRVCNFASFLVAVVLNSLGSTGHLSSSGKGVGDVSNVLEYHTPIPASAPPAQSVTNANNVAD